MTILNPWAWCLALAALPIIVFFFLKTRLRDKTMTTSLFWDEIIESQRIRALGYRFRHPVSLFLSLLFVGLVVGAALDPVFSRQKYSGGTVIILDDSASMNAVGRQGKTRFELARNESLCLISRQESGRATAILSAGGEPEIVLGFTDHRPTLRDAVLALKPADAPTSIGRAVEMAKILTRNSDDARIFVFTDGCFPEADFPEPNRFVTIIPVGEPLENVAITGFQVRRSMVEAVGFEIFAEVANFSEKTVSLRLTLELHADSESDVEVIDLIPISLSPGKLESVIVQGRTERGGVVVGSLFVETENDGEFHDALEADNTAYAVLPMKTKQKILLYGEEDFFLRKALESLPNVELENVAECPKTVEPDSLLVIHSTLPATLPEGNVLIVDPGNDCNLFSVGDRIESPIVVNMEKDSPLLKFVRLENHVLSGARRLGFSPELKPEILLATPENEPILIRWNSMMNDPGKKIVLSADLEQGELAFRTAFPILLSNALTFFRGGGGEMRPAAKAGESFEWILSESDIRNIDGLRLRSPDGSERKMIPVKDKDEKTVVHVVAPDRTGIWELISPDGLRLDRFPCNIVDRIESDLRTASNGKEFPAISASRQAVPRPIRFWLVGTAFFLIVLDWFLYHRRWVE